MTPNPQDLMPSGSNLDVMFGRLPVAVSRRGIPSGNPGRPAKTPGGRKLLTLLDTEPCLRDEPDARATFSLEGEYGAQRDPDLLHLIIPAGWCATDEPEEIWRCVSLRLRLKLLRGYSRVSKPNEPFTVDMREAIVDGLAFFLRIRSVADGEDARVYETLREALNRMSWDRKTSSALPVHLLTTERHIVEAYAWLKGGLLCADDETRYFLDEKYFACWLGHDLRRPVATLVGMLSLLERSLYGTDTNLRQFSTMGVVSLAVRGKAQLLKRLPAPWDIPVLLVAEAIDRAVREEQFVTKSAIMHVEYALATEDGQETLRRLLSPFGDLEAQSNAMALRA